MAQGAPFTQVSLSHAGCSSDLSGRGTSARCAPWDPWRNYFFSFIYCLLVEFVVVIGFGCEPSCLNPALPATHSQQMEVNKKHVPNHQPAPVMFRYGTPLRMIFLGAKMCIRLQVMNLDVGEEANMYKCVCIYVVQQHHIYIYIYIHIYIHIDIDIQIYRYRYRYKYRYRYTVRSNNRVETI